MTVHNAQKKCDASALLCSGCYVVASFVSMVDAYVHSNCNIHTFMVQLANNKCKATNGV